ncbi:hypothetical protein VRK_00130 [Vibrio sp. MEBiC08052]|nr:hypothetical protein VRK_00130 [Vibrio sp. MEBiC08052]
MPNHNEAYWLVFIPCYYGAYFIQSDKYLFQTELSLKSFGL